MEMRINELSKNIVIVVAIVLAVLLICKICIKLKKYYTVSKSTEEIRLLKKAIIKVSDAEDERDIKFYRNNDEYYVICKGKKFNINNIEIKKIVNRAIEYKETGFDGSIITKIDISMRGNELVYKSSDIDLYSKDFLSLKTEIARECYKHDLKNVPPCDVVIEQTSVKTYEAKIGNDLFLTLRGHVLKRIVDNQVCIEDVEDDNNNGCISIKLIYNCVIDGKYWYDVAVK